MQMMSEM
jgi:hypothetical protein